MQVKSHILTICTYMANLQILVLNVNFSKCSLEVNACMGSDKMFLIKRLKNWSETTGSGQEEK